MHNVLLLLHVSNAFTLDSLLCVGQASSPGDGDEVLPKAPAFA